MSSIRLKLFNLSRIHSLTALLWHWFNSFEIYVHFLPFSLLSQKRKKKVFSRKHCIVWHYCGIDINVDVLYGWCLFIYLFVSTIPIPRITNSCSQFLLFSLFNSQSNYEVFSSKLFPHFIIYYWNCMYSKLNVYKWV